jgi:hypothetical protein
MLYTVRLEFVHELTFVYGLHLTAFVAVDVNGLWRSARSSRHES